MVLSCFKLDSGKVTFDIGDIVAPVIKVLHVKGKCVIRPNIRLTHFPILILRAIYRERREWKIAVIHQKTGHRHQKWILGYFHISQTVPFPSRNVYSLVRIVVQCSGENHSAWEKLQ